MGNLVGIKQLRHVEARLRELEKQEKAFNANIGVYHQAMEQRDVLLGIVDLLEKANIKQSQEIQTLRDLEASFDARVSNEVGEYTEILSEVLNWIQTARPPFVKDPRFRETLERCYLLIRKDWVRVIGEDQTEQDGHAVQQADPLEGQALPEVREVDGEA